MINIQREKLKHGLYFGSLLTTISFASYYILTPLFLSIALLENGWADIFSTIDTLTIIRVSGLFFIIGFILGYLIGDKNE